MALPAQQQAKYWSIAAVALFAALWALGNVLLPFVLGCAIAYIMDPIADRLQKLGLSRVLSVTVISVLFVMVFVIVSLLVVPTLIRQAIDLVNTAPELFDQLKNFVSTQFPSITQENSTLNQSLESVGEAIRSRGGTLLKGILTSAMSLVNILVLLVVVPVVSFYMLIDWDRMVARVDDLLPRDHAPTLRRLAGEIDVTLASFIRGQGLVCLIQGTFYSISLMLVGLNFGLVVGAIAGLVTFIPYVGAIVGGALAIGLAIFQFWDQPLMILVVAAIFFAGQMIEGNILTPKLVGESVGLHPVWLLLALSVFGSLFGFVGMLVAVPVSAMIGVIVRFVVEKYKEGRLYRGLDVNEATVIKTTVVARDQSKP